MIAADAEDFIERHTRPVRIPLVPEINLHLAREPYGIFQAAEECGLSRPYWAFAWPGGQAIARWLLDHPELVSGRRVLDIGSGSALAAIAAVKAGADSVVANDVDPMASTAAGRNAAHNQLDLRTDTSDLLGDELAADVVLIGEVFYEPEMALRVTAFLERTGSGQATILFADRKGIRRPPVNMTFLAEIDAPLTPGLGIAGMDIARLWRLDARAPRSTGKRVGAGV